jgi:hypothetical protein
LDAALTVVSAVASRENAVQVVFSHGVYFSALGDVQDAADPAHYLVLPIDGTVGLDGQPARPVTVQSVAALTPPPGAFPNTIVELTLDRPMTPFPSQYSVTASGLFTADLSLPIEPSAATQRFAGVFKEVVPPQVNSGHPMRDLANPQTQSALVAANASALLGSFATDSSGDYAFDQGIVGFKKRILRRLVTRAGGFAHLGSTYGVGVPAAGKKLASAANRANLAAEAEKQIGQEPETSVVRVTSIVDTATPEKTLFRIYVRPKVGQPTTFDVPLPVK